MIEFSGQRLDRPGGRSEERIVEMRVLPVAPANCSASWNGKHSESISNLRSPQPRVVAEVARLVAIPVGRGVERVGVGVVG